MSKIIWDAETKKKFDKLPLSAQGQFLEKHGLLDIGNIKVGAYNSPRKSHGVDKDSPTIDQEKSTAQLVDEFENQVFVESEE